MAFEDFISRHWDESIPVNLTAFSDSMQVGIHPALEGDYIVLCEYDTRRIWVNVHATTLTKRFAVAHALGHFALGHLKAGEIHADRKGSYNDKLARYVDRKANQFALELLMPASEMEMHCEGGASLEDSARRMGVSQSALMHRAKTLGLSFASPAKDPLFFNAQRLAACCSH